ncbi:MAG TPA: universal stress protein [Nocardioidaceae bacterium]|nr:universal stress protein [Nocardioidaceae bacterium]
MDMSVVHDSVVVGVDGSPAGAAALSWAARYAAVESRALTVVHACGFPGAMPDFEDIIASERGLRSVGRTIAAEAECDARVLEPLVAMRTMVVMGNAAPVLVEASETAALVVVGARGRGALASMLLGSVSSQVTREAQCPVVVVRDDASEAVRGPVVVGVDGTAASSAAVEFAFHRAAMERRPLTVLHASWDLRTRVSAVPDLSSYAERVAETVAGLCERYPDVAVTERYRRGEPVRQLVEASREASLVVVGSRGRRLLSRALSGSVSRAVAERAACPVAVARP